MHVNITVVEAELLVKKKEIHRKIWIYLSLQTVGFENVWRKLNNEPDSDNAEW